MCLNQEWVFWMLSNNHKKFSSLHCKNRHVYLESWIIYRRKHKINCSRFALNTKYLKNQQEFKVLVWKNKSLNLMNLIKKEFKLITSIWNKISDLFFSILKPKEIFKSVKILSKLKKYQINWKNRRINIANSNKTKIIWRIIVFTSQVSHNKMWKKLRNYLSQINSKILFAHRESHLQLIFEIPQTTIFNFFYGIYSNKYSLIKNLL